MSRSLNNKAAPVAVVVTKREASVAAAEAEVTKKVATTAAAAVAATTGIINLINQYNLVIKSFPFISKGFFYWPHRLLNILRANLGH
jgi:hypothetical protein